ncbi:NmrA family NAD(P)-binding protein [Candidatus Bathyarchaeota archaeon]|nr:NmrA family NAD(P)-binding protein [Candidatus Bathyarchaeota archaeon]
MSSPVFVCGATGTQGGHVARHLRKAGIPVHALVRDPLSPQSKALEAIGVTIFPGSWDDKDALTPALEGTESAFLNFIPSLADPRKELRDAEAVLAVAKSSGVKHIVYSGILGLEEAASSLSSNSEPNGIGLQIFQTKRDILEAVVSAGFGSYTVLLVGKFMNDFYGNAVHWFGDLSKTGVFETALLEGEGIPFVDPDDIGAFGAAALLDPKKFAGQSVEVYTEMLAPEKAIAMLSEALGKKMSVRFMSEEEVDEKRKADVFIMAQVAMRELAKLDSMDRVRSWGVPVGSFGNFLERERAVLEETYALLPDVE